MSVIQRIGFNCQAEKVGYLSDHPEIPIIAILHDDMPNYYAAFAGLNVWAYRAMSPYSASYHSLPPNARFIFDNEADNDPNTPAWVEYLTQLKKERPDVVLISPASNCSRWPADGEWPEDDGIKQMCYFYGLHIPTFASVEEMKSRVGTWGNPWAVTEVEADPGDPSNSDASTLVQRLLNSARTALLAGAQFSAIWGKDPQMTDGVTYAQLRDQVASFNAEQIANTSNSSGGNNGMAFSVGPGFKTWCGNNGYSPASDEFYIAGDQVSCACVKSNDGSKPDGTLFYVRDTNKVGFVPFQ